MPEDDDEQARLDDTEFGKLLHRVMQRVDFTADLPAQLPALLEALVADGQPPVSLADADRLAACLRRFQSLPLALNLARATALHRELRFLAREGEVFVPGIIDLLAQVDGAWWLIDYKTGRPSATHLRQLALYALGVTHTLGVTPTRAIVVYLSPDAAYPLRDEPITENLLTEARRLLRVAAEGLSAEDYHPNPGDSVSIVRIPARVWRAGR